MSAHVIERVVRRNSSPDGHLIRAVTTGPSITIGVPGPGYGPLYQGVPFYAYGYSWMQGTGAARSKWLDRLDVELGVGTMVNRAVGGDTSVGVWQEMVEPDANKWVPNTTGVVLVECALNDLRYIGTDADSITVFKRTVGAMCYLLRSASLTEQSVASFSGGWNAGAAHGSATNGLMTWTNGVGQYADIAFTGTEITIHVLDLAAGYGGGTFTVKEGATLLATHSSAAPASMPPHYDFAFPNYVHITGLAAGAHTLRLEMSAAGTIYFDGWTLPMPDPPTVVLIAAPYLDDYTATGAPWDNGSDAAVDAYRVALEQVAALFPADEVIVVDPNVGWDKTTMLNADTVHPNDRGAAHIAASVAATLRNLDYRTGVQLT